ncbi:hypothetical protein K488DRAFT_86564 [Vararia minispora EC-137]|uniref:Uncharacterized protein n=1 Tax=Vararia minispora EC-137 TaxID=1314806 RepID=A0ACB8QK72_9AGAM|nr:hypothetical protein K488DRAFT_86564 [Vararia minispora EC-137]
MPSLPPPPVSVATQPTASSSTMSPSVVPVATELLSSTTPSSSRMPPPPTLPDGALTLVRQSSPTHREPTHAEKRSAWDQRVSLLTQLSDKQQAYENLRVTFEGQMKLINSSYFTSLSHERQLMFHSRLGTLEQQKNESKAALEEVERKLIQAGFWPVMPGHSLDTFTAQWAPIRAKTEELLERVNKYSADLRRVMPSEKVLGKQREGEPPAKRARLEGDGAEDVDMEEGEVVIEDGNDLDYAKFFGDMQGWVQVLERDIDELRNHLEQQTNEALQETQGMIDDHIHAILTGEVPLPPECLEVGSETGEEVKRLERSFEELKDEIALLKAEDDERLREKDEEIAMLKEENAALRELLDEAKIMYEGQRAEFEAVKRAIDTQSVAIARHIANPSTPSALPSPEVILHHLQDPITALVQQSLTPLFQQYQRDVASHLRQHQDDMAPVWDKISMSHSIAHRCFEQLKITDPKGLQAAYESMQKLQASRVDPTPTVNGGSRARTSMPSTPQTQFDEMSAIMQQAQTGHGLATNGIVPFPSPAQAQAQRTSQSPISQPRPPV